MVVSTSKAVWEGTLREGEGNMVVGDGAYEGPYTFASRFETGEGTNPETLIAAAHASCFSMALSADLGRADFDSERVATEATVHLEDGAISLIELVTEAEVPGIDEDEFLEIAEGAKENCPVSKALAAVDVTLDATLVA
ncbi:MAG: OsmC family peroxiredoxin [Halobacteriota archaeon]